jgi:ATP-dependent DNA helicase DinG
MMTLDTSYIANFPFDRLRANQEYILKQIEQEFNSGYNFVCLEAPTGFGKSPVAVASALSEGSSWICTSTKNLQTQYNNDFKWITMAKGRGNFRCPMIKEDAPYRTADHAPCVGDSEYPCSLKTRLKDYWVRNKGTRNETVMFDGSDDVCDYYHQRNKGLTASSSILNYSMFLSLFKMLPTRNLLVLDEAHEIPNEILKFQKFSISRLRCQKYMGRYFKIPNLGYDVIKWADFLIDFKKTILEKMGVKTASNIAEIEHKILQAQSESQPNQPLINKLESLGPFNIEVELKVKDTTVDTREDLARLDRTIATLSSEPKNWIVSDMKFDAIDRTAVATVELKPLDLSRYCKRIFDKGCRVLMMSATILDVDAFCKEIGLETSSVKVIKVSSTFPLENRRIYPLNIAQLNKDTFRQESVRQAIVKAVDYIMTHHNNSKGIIHCTSYDQLNLIMTNLSKENRRRLIKTDADLDRDEVISKHIDSEEPTVLISPSLYLGLDLKDDLSRFQIVVKVPYANLGDRWINARYNGSNGKQWYAWISALHLVQAYGRSVRSETDWIYGTYIIDSGFQYFVNKNKQILPTWFTDAICWKLE